MKSPIFSVGDPVRLHPAVKFEPQHVADQVRGMAGRITKHEKRGCGNYYTVDFDEGAIVMGPLAAADLEFYWRRSA